MWFWTPAAGTAPRSRSSTPRAFRERRITYAAYGEMVELAARGLVAAGIRPGEMVGIFLPNCWEFGVAYHAAMLAGATPDYAEPHLSRARGALSAGKLRRGRAHQRWLAAQWH